MLEDNRYRNCDMPTLLEQLEKSTPQRVLQLRIQKVNIDYEIERLNNELNDVRQIVHRSHSSSSSPASGTTTPPTISKP